MTAAEAAETTTTDSTDNDFSCIEPHPYGVLPSGNVYFASTTRRASQSPLPEELWQQVLSFCDGITLAQTVVQVCRDWYVAGHQPELWRDLVLREYGESLQKFVHCWKDTYVVRKVGKLQQPHQPMAVPGVFSEVYYRTHLCRSFQIPPSWKSVEGGTIERVTTPLSTHDFLTRYEAQNKPVVLAGACKSWKAFQKWNTVDYLDTASNKQTFRATSGAAPLPANFSLQAYREYCHSPLLEEAPLYLFDRTALLDGALKEDYYGDLQQTCPFWDPSDRQVGHDLLQYLGEAQRPDHTWLICGPQRSGSAFHIDPNGTHAWNAAIVGKKRWIFYPPGVTPPGVYPSPQGDSVAMPISIGEWLLNYYQQEHVPNLQNAPLSCRPLECTVEPGDVIFVPHGWWHAVFNLEEGVNVAITHNYVSQSNLATVLRFMEYKEDQISGCRDREESIKPEFLKRQFDRCLRENGFEEMLQKAQEVADQGWPCRAWSDDIEDDGKHSQHQQSSMMNHRKRRREPATACDNSSIMAMAKKNMSTNEAFSFSFL